VNSELNRLEMRERASKHAEECVCTAYSMRWVCKILSMYNRKQAGKRALAAILADWIERNVFFQLTSLFAIMLLTRCILRGCIHIVVKFEFFFSYLKGGGGRMQFEFHCLYVNLCREIMASYY
jgi:hypothetical protein